MADAVDLESLRVQAEQALGVVGLTPFNGGGQKLVLVGTVDNQDVVVKLIPLPPGDMGATVLERAQREVALLAEVDNPRVVKVVLEAVELGDGPDAVCWAEEKLEGADLGATLGSEWDPDLVAQLLADLAEGLSACHEREVVHRDLSPGNVRRLPDDRFTLMDPGLARHLNKTALTGVYQPGTAGYRSPEHVPGGDPIPASDVFAVGILAYAAATGSLPIQPPASEAEYDRILQEDQVASVLVARPTLAPGLAEVIDRCLQRQPARRYLDANELLDDLKAKGLA